MRTTLRDRARTAGRATLRRTAIATTSTALVATAALTLAPTASAAPNTPPAPAADAAAPAVAPTTATTTPTLTPAQRKAARVAARAAKVRAIRAKVVKVARAQLRDSYVAGASGPNAFDCSGFTRYVWQKAAGRSLPHYSRAQYGMGRKVSIAQARPGDLVFYFGSGAHHVGLYIGNGKMIHAANSRSDVQISSIKGPWYASRFSGIRSIIQG